MDEHNRSLPLLDGDRLIASTNGYIYCLDPATGDIRWHNPLKGYGMGAPTALASLTIDRSLVVTGGWSRSRALIEIKRRRFGELVQPEVTEAGARGAALLGLRAAAAAAPAGVS